MPIHDRKTKIEAIISVISDLGAVPSLVVSWGTGPSLYFYKKLLESRRKAGSVATFLDDQHNLELAYGLLAIWGMDSRRASLKDFASFSGAVQKVRIDLIALEGVLARGSHRDHAGEAMRHLGAVYDGLHVMESGNKLVSNAKLGHFCLPDHLMPIDGENTQEYLYGGKSDSKRRYLEIIQFSFDLRSLADQRQVNWAARKDDDWNPSVPKIIDNAINYLQGREKAKEKHKNGKDDAQAPSSAQ
jgi:hypothetical protein